MAGSGSRRALGTPTENASKGSNDLDKAGLSRARPRPPPLYCGRDHACRTGLQGAGTKVHADPPQVLQALLSSHRPLGAYEVIDKLAKSMPRPAPITVYRALDFLMTNSLVHRIESRNAYLACAHDHDQASLVAFLICERCGSVGEIPAASRRARLDGCGTRLRLCAKTLRRRNHRHLRPLPAGGLTHDPEKCAAVFRKDHAQKQ